MDVERKHLLGHCSAKSSIQKSQSRCEFCVEPEFEQCMTRTETVSVSTESTERQQRRSSVISVPKPANGSRTIRQDALTTSQANATQRYFTARLSKYIFGMAHAHCFTALPRRPAVKTETNSVAIFPSGDPSHIGLRRQKFGQPHTCGPSPLDPAASMARLIIEIELFHLTMEHIVATHC